MRVQPGLHAALDVLVKGIGGQRDEDKYEVEDTIVVYTYSTTSRSWSVAKGSSNLTSARKGYLNLIDTDEDEIYDIAVIVK